MQKAIAIAIAIVLVAFSSALKAQTIDNKDWKTFLGSHVNDTVTFHMRGDSSFVTNGKGDVVLHVQCAFQGDTLSVSELGPEGQGCAGVIGKYRFLISKESVIFKLVQDDCSGRSESLMDSKWYQVQ